MTNSPSIVPIISSFQNFLMYFMKRTPEPFLLPLNITTF